ncbi:PREDICTED: ran-specific GTPase-activating protein [Elephantulus edwardii]|uniref:ran-specific GTPase-activating protein n=1 Tax=Elephantulus edwardii TaxID=28737 RepID=UPI0003F0CCBD|nr:PREDICTED: ran-specific GTPase-activating protein [Elephantulus edwardii]
MAAAKDSHEDRDTTENADESNHDPHAPFISSRRRDPPRAPGGGSSRVGLRGAGGPPDAPDPGGGGGFVGRGAGTDSHEDRDTTENADESNHDPQFEPIVSLPEQEIKTLEEDEEELFKMRAKLYRFASENDLPEWKERGTGDVKLLKHKEKGSIRLLMRRDKTLKICANHYITPLMELKPNAGSDRAWVWNTHADFADEYPKPELLAIRFLNAENAQKFKTKFEECRKEIEEREKKGLGKNDNAEKVAEKLEALSVKEDGKEAPGVQASEGEEAEKAEEKQ